MRNISTRLARPWTGLAVALLLPLSGAAQPGTPAPARVLTLDEALKLADQHNPQLHAAEATNAGALAAITTARAYPNPEFQTLAGHQYRRQPGAAPGLLQHYSVAQPIELPSVRQSRIQSAQHGRESTQFGLSETRLGVRAAVKQSFYLVLRRRGEVELARETLRLIEDLERRVEAQVKAGEAARLEQTRAEAEVATARTFANAAQLRLLTAVAELRTVVGAPLGPQIDPQGTLEKPGIMPPLDELRTEVLDKHPGLAQAQAEIRRAEAKLRNEIALRKPSPEVYTEWERQPDLGFYRFGVRLPVPLWNKREGPISEATAAVTQAKAYADVRRLELTSSVERAYGLYEVATQQVASFEQGVLKEAEAALQAAEAAFRFGERGILEVLDAQRVLRSVRLDFLNAQYDLQAALIEIERLRAGDTGVTR